MEILECLNQSKIIQEFEIQEFRDDINKFYFKIKALLTNGSELYIKEYISATERVYSYHWQTAEGQLIIRWDNAPFHKEVITHPHHLHRNNEIKESYSTDLSEVLMIIEGLIIKID